MKIAKINRARWENQQCQNLVTEVDKGDRYPLVSAMEFVLIDSKKLLRTVRGMNAPRPYITSANRDIRVPASQMYISFVGEVAQSYTYKQAFIEAAFEWGLKACEVYQPTTCLNIAAVVGQRFAKATRAARAHFKASAIHNFDAKDVRKFLNDICLSEEPLLVNSEFSATTFEILSVLYVTGKGKLVKLPSRSGKSKTPFIAFFSETPRFIVKPNGNPNGYSRQPLSYRIS
jgi:hypothetical protein